MMNKGLEVIEAKWLFDVPAEKIQIVVHPQSIVHSAVEYCDGIVLSAQMGLPDMQSPDQRTRSSYPERMEMTSSMKSRWISSRSKNGMTFYPADAEVFRTIGLALRGMQRAAEAIRWRSTVPTRCSSTCS